MRTDKDLTPLESLELITTMIKQAKGNAQHSSFYFLLWGWTILLANLGAFIILQFTASRQAFLAFGLTIPAAIVSTVYASRQGKKTVAPTHLDLVRRWTWTGFGITCIIFAVFGQRIGWQINPVIITMTAAPTLVTGVMLRFKPLLMGAVVFWVAGVASFLVPVSWQFLVSSTAIALGYILPGYLLKKSEA